MTTLAEYLEARARVAADLADDERAYPGRSFTLVYRADLRTILAGPPSRSRGPGQHRQINDNVRSAAVADRGG